MKPHIILHIGMPKTGTTALQRALATSLADPTFTYVRLEGSNDCNHLFSLFSHQPERYHLHQRLASTPEEILAFNNAIEAQLVAQIDTADSTNTIISAESLSALKPVDLLNLREFLLAHFREISIVAYVRPPRSAMESGFQQALKGTLFPGNIDDAYPRYRAKFEKFDQIFGSKNVYLWPFSPKSLRNRDVVDDFCFRLGISLAPGERDARDNESLSLPALKLLYTYRKFYPYRSGKKSVVANNLLVSALRQLRGGKLRFSKDFVAPVLAARRQDVEWMEQRLGCAFSEEGDDADGAVRSEADLLAVDNDSLAWIRQQVNDPATDPGVEYVPKLVADLVHDWRERLAGNLDLRADEGLSMRQVAIRLKRSAPAQFGEVLLPVATSLVSRGFRFLHEQLSTAGNAIVEVEGLGSFRCGTRLDGDVPRCEFMHGNSTTPVGSGERLLKVTPQQMADAACAAKPELRLPFEASQAQMLIVAAINELAGWITAADGTPVKLAEFGQFRRHAEAGSAEGALLFLIAKTQDAPDASRRGTPDQIQTSLLELVQAVKGRAPDLLGDVPDRKLVTLLRAAFTDIIQQIAAPGTTHVDIPEFGSFSPESFVRVKDGETIEQIRAAFEPSGPKVRPVSDNSAEPPEAALRKYAGAIRELESDTLGNLPLRKATVLLRAAFTTVSRLVATSSQAPVKVAEFGQFRHRVDEQMVNGRRVMQKRIVFFPALGRLSAK